jgi:hypothetical protein
MKISFSAYSSACTLPLLLLLLIHADESFAGPADYVYRTYDNAGQRTVALYAGSTAIEGAPRASGASLAFGYGVNASWFSNLYIGYARENGSDTKFEGVEWQNIFRLTHGQYPVDVGLLTELARPQARDEGYAMTIGPLFETEFGRTQLNFNLLLSRSYRAADDNPMKLGYQWQVRHHWTRLLEPGLQGFGDMGKWNQWNAKREQSHRLGPALFGTYVIDARHAIQYNLAYLFETTNALQQNTFRLQTVFEF